MYIQQMAKAIFPSVQNVSAIHKQITIHFFYQVSSRLVTLCKFIYASEQVSNNFVLSVSFKLINVIFQIFLYLFLKVSTSFTSYTSNKQHLFNTEMEKEN
jgi:hypothetical protein